MTAARVVLRARRARPFFGKHPWVYAGAIDGVTGEPADGDVVDVVSHAGNFVARGLYNAKSNIRVRLYSWSAGTILDEHFFRARLEDALRLRGPILGLDGPGRACRLVFSEADGLSGLTVDRYDRWLVVQFTSLGLGLRREMIAGLLEELLHPEGIFVRTERGIGKLEGLELQDGILRGVAPQEPVTIEENGVRFRVNIALGQKTGFYLDQRDNRSAAARYAAGRRVLDGFCYTGGFGIYAARAGAVTVFGVDVSESALELARENARLNEQGQMTFMRDDVFDRLNALVESEARFDMVVLDPPKFARARHAIDEALRGYRRLHTQAFKLLEPDGILVTCCCSGLITRDMLLSLLAHQAAEENRAIQVLEVRGQAADHPVAATCLESDYLKCIIARIA
jgi:23S rRNA (cytosine1962-C5)-methyltransferase